ncbi:16S rRNA (uracil(1498)-N(3))-methyltransferase [Helicobacter sp. 12S02634-8]|uniref:16S rRNA (uracil(1498)-N(3))-methyltransferase n=1 Tax=Helicobacter sp. 12S02634-8 TaxID=1476199 RepID=UPI000BA52FCA|nr:16S rRNA (uracil(1498)-N(3))-methyltransferase [Helicobacter sp. 12S02634-8]PAF47800.1 16S rRNA (uracil(1498)-N(3))-methyltransferase [Helicobacter sp. 12S02634-8]
MHFAYCPEASKPTIKIEGNLYNHIYQSRRTKLQENLFFRNLTDGYLYTYTHTHITRNYAELDLQSKHYQPNLPKKEIHIIWAIIDNKSIEKILPYLNQIGVGKISFFYAHRSQKNEKIALERWEKILIHSCEQCGRGSLMTLEMIPDTPSALQRYPNACVFDFGGKDIYAYPPALQSGIFIGPEGGFTPEERELFKAQEHYSITQGFTLKSECAALLVSTLGH